MAARINDLDASQLARHAFNVFMFSGRHQQGARLIYRALEMDPHNTEALRCLSDLLDAEGTEVFSAVVLEYALSEEVGLQGEERKTLDDLLFLAKWSWGFSRHNSGEPYLKQEDFADRSAFVIDEAGYNSFLQSLLESCGSLQNGFNAAQTLCGTMAEFLVHEQLGGEAEMTEIVHPERFHLTVTHAVWLESSTKEFDALEVARAKASTEKKPWWKFWQ
jgi:hypothetical protein